MSFKKVIFVYPKVSAMAGETPIMSPSMEPTMVFKAIVPTGWLKRSCPNTTSVL